MGGVFSNSAPPPKKKKSGGTISDVDRAVLDLKNARDRLTRYKKKLLQEEEKLLARAKESKDKGQTKTALGLLRLRRYKEREVENVENQLLTILQMVETIDSKQNEKEFLSAMKTGKDSLAKLHQETTVEDVLTLMDQIQEQNEVENEITEILSGVPTLSVQDEADVEAELAAMEAELNGDVTLPVAPDNKLPEPQEVTQPVPTKPAKVAVPS